MIDADQGIFKRSMRQIYLEEEMAKRKAKPSKTQAKASKSKQGNGQGYLTLPQDWSDAGKLYRWNERKDAFETHQREIDDAVWEERMKNLREKRWTFAQTLFGKAETMAKMPLVKQTVTTNGPNGSQVTIIEPADWSLRDIVAFLKTASDLGGEAIGNLNWAAAQLESAGFEISNPQEPEPTIPDLPEDEFG